MPAAQVEAWRVKTPRTPTRLAVGLGAEGAPSRRELRFAPREFGSPAPSYSEGFGVQLGSVISVRTLLERSRPYFVKRPDPRHRANQPKPLVRIARSNRNATLERAGEEFVNCV